MAGPSASGTPPVWTPPTEPIVSRSKDVVTLSVVFMVSAVAIIGVRFWVRMKMVGKIGLDDWFIGLATALTVLMGGVVIVSTKYGAGRHMKDIPPADIPMGLKYNLVSQVLSVVSMWMIKVSVAMFLLRLAVKRTYRYICLGFVSIISMYSFASILGVIFQCVPISKIWDITVPGRCLSPEVRVGLGRSYGIICAASDFFLVLLPIAMLWETQISRRQRWMICSVLGVGTFAAAASIVKTTYMYKYGSTGDFLWDSVDITIWVTVENDVGIISSSMPALKPLIAKIVEKTMTSITGGGSNSQPHTLSALRREGGALGGFKGGITTDIRANGKRGATTLDCESEEMIFGISKSTDVRVDVETVSASSGDIPQIQKFSGRR